jgi:hypothetical protein
MKQFAPAAMIALALASLWPVSGFPGPNHFAELQAIYDHETDPVHRANDLAKLEPDQFAAIRDKLSAGDEVEALQELEHFRDEVTSTITALQPFAPKAESHPDGFKNLQIALREALRELDGIITGLDVDKRPWFRAVRSDLQDSQNVLIDALFPQKPGKTPNKNPSPGDPK